MSLTILASVSLLALVSSARPIQPYHTRTDSVQSLLTEGSEDFRQTIQAVVRTHASVSEEIRIEDDIEVQLTTVEQIQAFLSSAQEVAVKAVIPLNHELAHSPGEEELHNLLTHLADDAIDKESIISPIASDGHPHPNEDDALSSSDEELNIELPQAHEDAEGLPNPHLVIVVSSALALTAVAFIAVILYLVDVLQLRALESTKDLLPYFQKTLTWSRDKAGILSGRAQHLIHDVEGKNYTVKTRPGFDIPQTFTDEHKLVQHTFSPASPSRGAEPQIPILESCSIRDPSFATAAQAIADHLPAISVEKIPSSFDDLSVPGGLPMQELEAQRPMWFTRASEASALARAGEEWERRRGYGQYTIPGLDAALAMQLRPGFGASGDTAWLVRFIMALFGWCAVLMSGSNNHL